MTLKPAALVQRYEKLAAVSGNAFHMENAREHRDVLRYGSEYDADATREAIKQVCALIAAEV